MLEKALEYIRSHTDLVPEVALVLGSGLGALADKTQVTAVIPYSALEDFPQATAPTHKGELILGKLGEKNVVIFSGRFHLYEGYQPQEAVMTVMLAKALGAETLLLTNAAGGISKNLNCGDIMLISDHIASFVPSPLIGRQQPGEPRFPDMSNAYDKVLRQTVKETAKKTGITVKEGVYAQLTGPQFETPAEIHMLSTLGADAVGMSTVIETIQANAFGMRVCGISLITNLACGLLDKPLTADEVGETAADIAPQLEALITETLKAI